MTQTDPKTVQKFVHGLIIGTLQRELEGGNMLMVERIESPAIGSDGIYGATSVLHLKDGQRLRLRVEIDAQAGRGVDSV